MSWKWRARLADCLAPWEVAVGSAKLQPRAPRAGARKPRRSGPEGGVRAGRSARRRCFEKGGRRFPQSSARPAFGMFSSRGPRPRRSPRVVAKGAGQVLSNDTTPREIPHVHVAAPNGALSLCPRGRSLTKNGRLPASPNPPGSGLNPSKPGKFSGICQNRVG